MIFALLANAYSCWLFRGQSIFQTLTYSGVFLYILSYNAMCKLNISLPTSERVLESIIWIFCASYLVQYAVYPIVIFSGASNETLDSSDLRIRLVAQGLSSLGVFFGIGKIINKDGSRKYYLMTTVCSIIIVLMGFRTMIFAIVVFSLILLVRTKGLRLRTLVYVSVMALALGLSIKIPAISNKIDNMIVRQKEDNFTNQDYIRLIGLNYYTTKHFVSNTEYILGSGYPAYGSNSRYANNMEILEQDNSIYWVDWGLLGLSWIAGIPFVFLMIWYAVRSIFRTVDVKYYYLGIWFAYILTISITTKEFYRDGNLVVQAFVLFLIDAAHRLYSQDQQKEVL